MYFNLPNLLTFSRIGAIPVLLLLFMIPGDAGRWAACVVFTIAAVTDYFDGYIARSWNQLSELGRCLDPIADKLLVAAVLEASVLHQKSRVAGERLAVWDNAMNHISDTAHSAVGTTFLGR